MINYLIPAVCGVICLILAKLFVSLWVYQDAKKRELPAGIWVIVTLIGGNLVGLLLYVVVGRKQDSKTCDSCGSVTIGSNSIFCSACGKQLVPNTDKLKPNNRFLIFAIACVVLAFVSLGVLLFSTLTTEGFAFQKQIGAYELNLSGTAKNIAQDSSGNTWTISFDEATSGYCFEKKYRSEKQPISLSIDLQSSSPIQIIVTQGDKSITETVESGESTYGLSEFSPGKLNIQIICINYTTNFTANIVMETD